VDGSGRKQRRRSYRPKVEALEALRLLDAAALSLGPLIAEHGPLAGPTPVSAIAGHDAWDTALGQTRLADWLGPTATADPAAIGSGLAQLDKYLSRAWARAGIAPQQADDCTQAVYTLMLQNLGRDRFDRMAAEIGQAGIREVLSRETPEGPDFFRAIDTVKKRAQRERSHQPLDDQVETASIGRDGAAATWRGALREAIDRTLNPRETELIQATLMGKTPAEIAAQWGVAPKTVSNEKTRAIQKLREALVSDLVD
jgi:RNA polymerase sigma factor (sigma-70 family)